MGAEKLGTMLRRCRSERGLTGSELARAIGAAQGTISKLESGRLDPDLDFLSKFIQTLRVSREDAAALMRLAGVVPGGATPEKILQYLPVDFLHADFSRRRQETIAHAEARSKTIQVFNPLLIPGLLQSENYARHVLTLAGVRGDKSVERALVARRRRQETLNDKDKALTFVMTETALLARVGPATVLGEQFRHLKRLSETTGVRLGFIERRTPLDLLLPPAFYLLDRRVYIELPHGDLWLRERSHAFGTYHDLFKRLEGLAAFGDRFAANLDRLQQQIGV